MEDPVREIANLLENYSRLDDEIADFYEANQGKDPANELVWARDDAGVAVANSLRGLLESNYKIVKT